MGINIPDRLFKLMALIGMIIAGYCLYSIQSRYDTYVIKIFDINDAKQKVALAEMYDSLSIRMSIFAGMGIVTLMLSLLAWYNWEKKNISLTRQDEILYPCCQSCGKKFSSIREYGFNKDESKNLAFCKECFDNGEFVDHNLTVEKLVSEAFEAGYIETKIPKFKKTLEVRLKNLDRWKKIEY